jgi:hypothetical protein
MAINTTTVESNLTTKLNATSGTTDAKEFLLLGKAVEALTPSVTVTSIQTEGTTQVGLVTAEGTTQVAAVQAAGSGYLTTSAAASTYSPLANPTFTGTVNAAALTLSGDLTVNGTQTVLNTATLTVDDLNITVADGAADAAAANGAGLSVDGAGATFNYASTGDKWTMNKPLDVTGAVTATGVTVNGPLKINEVHENVQTTTGAGGYTEFAIMNYAILFNTANQTSNATVNFVGDGSNTLDSIMAVGESITVANMRTQGSTAYYISVVQIDGSAVSPKWVGGAPTGGNANAIDSYTFTIIKTASATFTVLANLTAYE